MLLITIPMLMGCISTLCDKGLMVFRMYWEPLSIGHCSSRLGSGIYLEFKVWGWPRKKQRYSLSVKLNWALYAGCIIETPSGPEDAALVASETSTISFLPSVSLGDGSLPEQLPGQLYIS